MFLTDCAQAAQRYSSDAGDPVLFAQTLAIFTPMQKREASRFRGSPVATRGW
jgi:hypothetical protein